MAGSTANHQDRAWLTAGTNENMPGPFRAVDEIPFPQKALLTFDKKFALALDNQKILLVVLTVVMAVRLAWRNYVDIDSVLLESPAALKAAGLAKFTVLVPTSLGSVNDVPAVALGSQTGFGLIDLRLRDHLIATVNHPDA